MSSFTQPLTVTKLPKGLWITERAFDYRVGKEVLCEVIHIPKGRISDGASIPKFVWSIVGHPMDEYAQGAFIHDDLYTRKIHTRKRSDQIFLESMKVLNDAGYNVPLWKRRVIYRSLRMFGWYAWRKKIKQETSL